MGRVGIISKSPILEYISRGRLRDYSIVYYCENEEIMGHNKFATSMLSGGVTQW